MTLIDALLLGFLQGITEFLPVSSSGHLVLMENYLKLDAVALKNFDIAVHFGTLLAILIYFRRDFFQIIRGAWAFAAKFLSRIPGLKGIGTHEIGKKTEQGTMLFKFLIIATIPAVLIGYFFGDFLDDKFRNPLSVAIMMIAVGVFFFVAEYVAVRIKPAKLTLLNTVIIGIAQACALVPGISRSGSTISTGLIQGIKRDEAARFSFLLGSVAITAAVLLSIYKAYKGDFILPPSDILVAGIASSFTAGLASIAFLMRFLKKHTLHIFGLYRVILGFVILYLM
jgi:undecaprenyl-diphosphatase